MHTTTIAEPKHPPIIAHRGEACMPALRAGADSLLGQCWNLLAAMPPETFVAPSRVLPGGTIGKHVRHLLDHYAALLHAAENPGAVIDYDHRARDERTQSDPSHARSVIASARVRVACLADHAEQRVVVELMTCGNGTTTLVASTLARELAFATHHAVHHQAMIGAIATEHGVAVPADFGKAPSTIAHEHPSIKA